MESCSKESIFRRYYAPQYVFTKPEYIGDDEFDNVELQNMESSRLTYNKSPKKENRQPNGNVGGKIEKSKRGTYNFNKQLPQQPNSSFITRSDMQKPQEAQEKRRKKSVDEKNFVWTLPPKWTRPK